MRGVWKADLFLGNNGPDNWVGTTVKNSAARLEGAQGLRIGIYPKQNDSDVPRKDDALNLVRLPLPYDGAFMETFYKAFFLVRAFLRADARVPGEEHLPDAEDRFLCKELVARRDYPILTVVEALRDMSQRDLLQTADVTEVPPTAALSEAEGLVENPSPASDPEFVTLSPVAGTSAHRT